MAKKEATLLLRIKQTGDKLIDKLRAQLEKIPLIGKKISSAYSAVAKSLGKVKAAGKTVFNTLTNVKNIIGGVVFGRIIQEIGKLALEADKFSVVKTAFKSLSESQGEDSDKMLENMRRLSAGTIKDLSLMQKANQALLLGLPVERFGEMLTIARSSAKATGESMDFMLNSIVTGLGRQSKLMLDNLGILVDADKANKAYAATLGKQVSQLTEAERKTAFINEALRIGTENAKKAGTGTLSLTDKWEQFTAKVSNAAIILGNKLGPAMGIVIDMGSKMLKLLGLAETGKVSINVDIEKSEQNLEMLRAGRAKHVERLKKLQADEDAWFKGSKEKEIKNTIAAQDKLIAAEVEANAKRMALLDADNTKRVEKAKGLATKKKEIADEEAARLQAKIDLENEQAAIAAEKRMLDQETQKENDALFQQALTDQKLQAQITEQDLIIASKTTHEKKKAAMDAKEKLRNDAIDAQKKKNLTAMAQFEQMINSNKVKGTQAALSQISSLQDSNNKSLAALGKAAASANIIISTAQGVMAAFALGPIIGPILAPIVAVAGAAQLAKVNGVQLETGGIVPGTVGGTQALIGEGGRAEAVVPLGDEGGPSGMGTTFNITVYGGLLGDESQAKEFAIAVDEELLKLRQANESQAFDAVT